ncbi:MAG TPA: serine hydrolase domain-containing protein, partial [Ignavibacteria bacterium]|nr:serine hydrolase domain-containing protein [Ignavibacteria bacterium]HMR40513.1 serine hydrolase domain-containing protein [Ignavibacteria bacterium]
MRSLNTLLKVSFFIFTSLTLSLNSGKTFSQSKTEKVKSAVDSIRTEYEKVINRKIHSLNILIHTPDDVIFVSSTDDDGIPVTKDSYFRFASNTKNFTSAAILLMQQKGWLYISDNITDRIPGSDVTYVPDSPEFAIPYKNQITIEQLLQHSAGVYDIDNDPVPGYDGLSYVDYMTFKDPAHQFELSELVNEVAKNQLSFFPPSKGYHYSNTGYTILSEIIERIYSLKSGSPKKYADFINDFITGSSAPVPLDISFPYLANDVSIDTPFVKGYLVTPDSTNVFTTVNVSAHVGEGNGYATFTELDRYVRSMMKGENVLNAQSIKLMQNSVSDSNKTYALGCFYIEDLGYGHNGCIKGYLSNMLYDPVTDVSIISMIPLNDYTYPDEEGIVYGLKALANAGFAARMALGYSGKHIPF